MQKCTWFAGSNTLEAIQKHRQHCEDSTILSWLLPQTDCLSINSRLSDIPAHAVCPVSQKLTITRTHDQQPCMTPHDACATCTCTQYRSFLPVSLLTANKMSKDQGNTFNPAEIVTIICENRDLLQMLFRRNHQREKSTQTDNTTEESCSTTPSRSPVVRSLPGPHGNSSWLVETHTHTIVRGRGIPLSAYQKSIGQLSSLAIAAPEPSPLPRYRGRGMIAIAGTPVLPRPESRSVAVAPVPNPVPMSAPTTPIQVSPDLQLLSVTLATSDVDSSPLQTDQEESESEDQQPGSHTSNRQSEDDKLSKAAGYSSPWNNQSTSLSVPTTPNTARTSKTFVHSSPTVQRASALVQPSMNIPEQRKYGLLFQSASACSCQTDATSSV